jgi:hypothetical protein
MKRQFLYRDTSNFLVLNIIRPSLVSLSELVQAIVVAGVLQHEHRKLSVRGYHDFVLVRSDSNECDVFLWVQCFDSCLGFGVELVY